MVSCLEDLGRQNLELAISSMVDMDTGQYPGRLTLPTVGSWIAYFCSLISFLNFSF